MSNSWLVTVKYTDENLSDSLYFLRANNEVEAIRNALDSSEWAPTGEVKSISPEQLIVIEIDDSINDGS